MSRIHTRYDDLCAGPRWFAAGAQLVATNVQRAWPPSP